jgi:hypothetical protein
MRRLTAAGAVLLLVPACSGGGSSCADVVAATASRTGDGTYRFEVTVRSADTGWDRYADRWEVVGPDGRLLGTRVLTHPHVEEQPFTRALDGVAVPGGIRSVTVRVHDSVEGFCGREAGVEVPG